MKDLRPAQSIGAISPGTSDQQAEDTHKLVIMFRLTDDSWEDKAVCRRAEQADMFPLLRKSESSLLSHGVKKLIHRVLGMRMRMEAIRYSRCERAIYAESVHVQLDSSLEVEVLIYAI